MKYKTYVNNTQLFGDNVKYEDWIAFIKSQGIKVDEEGLYEGDITDFMGGLTVIESILKELHTEREDLRTQIPDTTKRNLFDLSYIPKKLEKQNKNAKNAKRPEFCMSYLDLLMEAAENAYCFLPYIYYRACKDVLEKENCFAKPGHFNCFKVKDGMKIHVKAVWEDRPYK